MDLFKFTSFYLHNKSKIVKYFSSFHKLMHLVTLLLCSASTTKIILNEHGKSASMFHGQISLLSIQTTVSPFNINIYILRIPSHYCRVHNEKFRKGSFIQAQWKTDVSSKCYNTPTLLFNLDPMN